MKHLVGNITLEVLQNSPVIVYQNRYPKYDRFLPHLAKYLDGRVVEVGANMGLMCAAMAQNNPKLEFLCFEANDVIYDLLEKNAVTIVEKTGVYIETAKGFVGQTQLRLDDYFKQHDWKELALLKVDVDGMDWDVLRSWDFGDDCPLFFETDFQDLKQYNHFCNLIIDLSVNRGYKHFYLFDNFGGYFSYFDDHVPILRMMEYVWRLKTGHSNQTIYYFDILSCKDKDHENMSQAVEDYCK